MAQHTKRLKRAFRLRSEDRLNDQDMREYQRIIRLSNLDEIRKQDREWKRNNSEKCRAWSSRWRLKNLEYVKKRYRDYCKAYPEKVKAAARKSRLKHLTQRLADNRAWFKRNPHKRVEYQNKRRALQYASRSSIQDCSKKVELLRKERFCHWCCIRLTKENLTIDHVVPLTRRGRHIPDNLVACCRTCNNRKRNRLVEEWTWKLAA